VSETDLAACTGLEGGGMAVVIGVVLYISFGGGAGPGKIFLNCEAVPCELKYDGPDVLSPRAVLD